MARAHLFRPVTDEFGNLLYGASVTVRRADLNTTISQPIFPGPISLVEVVNPMVIPSGFVDIWLDVPERVNLLIETVGRAPISVFLDVQPPAPEVVRSSYPLTITNTPATDQILTGTSATEAAWTDVPEPPGGVPEHFHPGTGLRSVVLGTAAVASGANATAVGDAAQATNDNTTAFGQAAHALFTGATAFGSTAVANGDHATAVGYTASASQQGALAVGYDASSSGLQATAIGGIAQAFGDDSLALGYGASASGEAAVALGASSSASGASSLALGTGATAVHSHAVAVGPGVATTADNQIMLGDTTHTVLAVGGVRALADAALAGVASTLGFFGSAGVTQQTVTGGDGGDLVLRALLGYLDDLGLIVNASTEE